MGKPILGLLCCEAGGPHLIGRVGCWPWCPRGNACMVSPHTGWSMYVSYILQNEVLRGLLTEVRVLKGKEIKEVPRILGDVGAVIAVIDKITVPKHPEMLQQWLHLAGGNTRSDDNRYCYHLLGTKPRLSVQFSLVTKLCLTLCDPRDCSTLCSDLNILEFDLYSNYLRLVYKNKAWGS